MSYELKEGQGSLFKNKQRKSDSHPNARGEIKINGIVYEIAAWTKTTKNGEPWQSLSVKVKANESPKESPKESGGDFDDDIPF